MHIKPPRKSRVAVSYFVNTSLHGLAWGFLIDLTLSGIIYSAVTIVVYLHTEIFGGKQSI